VHRKRVRDSDFGETGLMDMTEPSTHKSPGATFDQEAPPIPAHLFAALYRELHNLAHRALKRRGNHLAISTTTLLHEAYINLNHHERGATFASQSGFLAYAARAMRGLIVDATRRGLAVKRGRGLMITGLHTGVIEEIPDERYLMRVDEALNALWQIDSSLAELVDLKYFCGLSLTEIGALRDLSERTMQRELHRARLLLLNLLGEDCGPSQQQPLP
jgi:RNA polymerase sigma factor (TIGR02999 family)